MKRQVRLHGGSEGVLRRALRLWGQVRGLSYSPQPRKEGFAPDWFPGAFCGKLKLVTQASEASKDSSPQWTRSGLVLSGGGVRGAYEVGVVVGIMEALGTQPSAVSPFGVIAGASVGAINASFVAANSHTPGLNLDQLVSAWTGMDFATQFSPQLLTFVRHLLKGRRTPIPGSSRLGETLLNPGPLEALVRDTVDFRQLHLNVTDGKLHGLFIAALEISSGRTCLFYELEPGGTYSPSKDPRRVAMRQDLTLEHILASTAVPLVFPARRVGDDYYCDGGLRFNTPIAPVIRAGARQLIVVSTTHVPPKSVVKREQLLSEYPSLAFVAGKVLNALLLDPMAYDLQILARINDLVDVHQRGLHESARRDLDRVMSKRRGATYRHIDTLVFAPSEDIAQLASQYLRDNLKRFDVGVVARRLLRSAADEISSDWVTYILFDGGFAERIIELGRRDALARRDEIRAFLGA